MQTDTKTNADSALRYAENNRTFRAWKCEMIDERMRPSGLAPRDGCGYWQINASKNPEPFATCKNCGRKSRLNPRTRKVYAYESKQAAQTHCEALNEHGHTQGLSSDAEAAGAASSVEHYPPDEDYGWWDDAVARGEAV